MTHLSVPTRLAALVLAGAVLAACGGASASPSPTSSAAQPAAQASASKPAAAAPEKLKIGYSTLTASNYLAFVTKGAGLYEKYGINADMQFMSPATVTAA